MDREGIAEAVAADQRSGGIDLPESAERAVAGLGTGACEERLEGIDPVGIVEHLERGEGRGAGAPEMEGRFGQMGRCGRLPQIGQGLSGSEADLGVGRFEPLLQDRQGIAADRLELERGGRGRDGIGELSGEELHPCVPARRWLDHRNRPDDADVAGEIVLVGRRDIEVEKALRLRGCHTALGALDDRVKAAVDRVTDALREGDRAVFRGNDQADLPRGPGDTAAGDAGADLRLRVEGAPGDRIDQERPFGVTEDMAVTDPLAEDRHLRQTGRHQPAAAEARRVVVGGDLDHDVEPIPLADAGRQVAMDPHKRGRGGGEELVRLGHSAGLHVGHEESPLGARRRIAPRPRKAGHERRPFDAQRMGAPGGRIVADESDVGFHPDQSRHLGALAADRGSGAADEGDQHRSNGKQPAPSTRSRGSRGDGEERGERGVSSGLHGTPSSPGSCRKGRRGRRLHPLRLHESER